jgi:putative SOS response-associated peptidase YedK
VLSSRLSLGERARIFWLPAGTNAAISGKPGRFHHIWAMCGRYASVIPADFLARLFGTVNPLPNLQPTWNMAPTKDAPVVRRDRDTGARHLDVLKWGLVPYFTKDLKQARKPINARSETVATSGMFREAFGRRRCLVPAAAYYEWMDGPRGKVPFAVARQDGDPVVFGGIWEEWRSADNETLRTFSTITTQANEKLSIIQDRMPVIIERQDWPLWLGEIDGDPTSLLRAVRDDVLCVWPVDKKVGNVRNDGPELLEPRPLDPELSDLSARTKPEQRRFEGMSTDETPSNVIKAPDDWTTGDETMTGAQASYLKTLSEEAGEEFDPSLSKAEASKRIDELQEMTGRGKTR